MPLIFVAAVVAFGLFLRAKEVPFIEPIILGLGVLSALFLALWCIFFTGLPPLRRWLAFAALIVLIAVGWLGVAQFTRVEGSIGGSGIPRLVWKWAPNKEGTTNALELGVPVHTTNAAPAESQASATVAAPAFPQFLGPNRSGVLPGPRLRTGWIAHPPQLKWRREIGLGWSAFAVSGGRAITQEQRRDDELIVCYHLETGDPLWAHTNRVRFSEALGGDGPRATPTIHEGRVYAMGATGILDCLQESTGVKLWSRDVLVENQLSNITWGKSCSPLIVGDLVVVTGGDQKEKSLLAYARTNGSPVWQAGRDRASYCSPLLGTLCGVEQIIVVNAHSVSGHSTAKGELLWEFLWPDKYAKVTQPLVIDDGHLFIAAGYGVGCALLEIKRDPDWSVVPVWRNRNLKPKFTNLVRVGDHVYGLDDGTLACVSLKDGSRAWKQGRYGHGQLLLVGDVLLVQAEAGYVAALQISPDGPKELSRFEPLTSKTWNNPVIAGDLLLVRNDHHAACYMLSVEAER